MASALIRGRRAGALVPLFSIPSNESWGVGEIADLPAFAAWARGAGLSIVQLLPVNEMADGQSSPYSALSAMSIDPIFIALRDVPEFSSAGGEQGLSVEQREQLQSVRRSPSVDYGGVRELKVEVLKALFAEFIEKQWRPGTASAAAMSEYLERERWWLDDYVLFRVLHEEHRGRCWLDWPAPLRDRDLRALADARSRLERKALYYAWLQWVAQEQWHRAHTASGVGVLGDFPFMVSGDSADVWARQHEFRTDASVGVPPDAFSETGQDWGLPVYRWDAHAASNYEWLRQRARRCAQLFDGFRVDHLVGFYRTYVREKDGSTYFVPPNEKEQLAQGERIMEIFGASGAAIIAEDLGTVPDFVRGSLAALGVPGLKVLRWEREWRENGKPFKDPASYPVVSVAISGTHDTETMAEWWDNANADERARIVELPSLRNAAISAEDVFSDDVRDALLEALYKAGSDLLLIPVQDVFGWRDRINTPALVSDQNWSWRLPWPVDRLNAQPEACDRAGSLRRLARVSRRSSRR